MSDFSSQACIKKWQLFNEDGCGIKNAHRTFEGHLLAELKQGFALVEEQSCAITEQRNSLWRAAESP